MRVALLAIAMALLVPAAAVAAGPPDATTGAAKSVTQAAATVTGTVDPQGSATTYRFESRDVDQLWPAERRRRRRLGHRSGRRLREPQRADDRHHLPLPRRGDQRGRDHARQRSRPEDRGRARAAGADHGLGAQRHAGRGAPDGLRSTPTAARRSTDHFEYGTSTCYGKRTAESQRGNWQTARRSRRASRPDARRALPLPGRGHQRRGRRSRARPQLHRAAATRRASRSPRRPIPPRGAARPRSADA